MFGPSWPGQYNACSVHHQYSSSVSPFQANTGMPATAIAAAAWSWVEKMLHDAQRTSAPSAVSVSIRTAVWIVMWSDPVIRAPASGFVAPYRSRSAMRPGISCSASWISLRPNSARVRSATLKSDVEERASVVVIVGLRFIASIGPVGATVRQSRPGSPDDSPDGGPTRTSD